MYDFILCGLNADRNDNALVDYLIVVLFEINYQTFYW